MAIAGATRAITMETTDEFMDDFDDTGLELGQIEGQTQSTGNTTGETSQPQEVTKEGMDYEFPGWDVVERVGEPITLDTFGREDALLSISWRDHLAERHVVQFGPDSRRQTYAFFPTNRFQKRNWFRWWDGNKLTVTDLGDACEWAVVEFALKGGDIHPDPYITMEVQCIAWQPHEDTEGDTLHSKCITGLSSLETHAKPKYCGNAMRSGITRAEDILRYGKQVQGGRFDPEW